MHCMYMDKNQGWHVNFSFILSTEVSIMPIIFLSSLKLRLQLNGVKGLDKASVQQLCGLCYTQRHRPREAKDWHQPAFGMPSPCQAQAQASSPGPFKKTESLCPAQETPASNLHESALQASGGPEAGFAPLPTANWGTQLILTYPVMGLFLDVCTYAGMERGLNIHRP